ncbi:MAG TPA: type II toxin-antitoxin system RelE/ParE family toxin [Chthoniobacter sp.]|jgi:plasmid stabilization system protein ParE
MAAENFRVIFAESALTDLDEIVEYWRGQEEPERGEQYAHDLPSEAIRLLSDPVVARSGRHLVKTSFPEVQELPVFKHSYRILYRVREKQNLVEVLRFWHSRRDEPFQD